MDITMLNYILGRGSAPPVQSRFAETRFAETRFAETRFAETPTLTLTLNPNP